LERRLLKKPKVEEVGVLRCCVLSIDEETKEWIEAREFNLAGLANEIGVDIDHEVKVKVTFEVVQEPCLFCGRLTSGDKLCEHCHVVLCDECAKTDLTGRYCPSCYYKREIEQLESGFLP